jgi:hypothetical protein
MVAAGPDKKAGGRGIERFLAIDVSRLGTIASTSLDRVGKWQRRPVNSFDEPLRELGENVDEIYEWRREGSVDSTLFLRETVLGYEKRRDFKFREEKK